MEPMSDNPTPLSPAVRRARLAAQRAGVLEGQPIKILTEDDLNRTIDGRSTIDGAAQMGPASEAMPSILGYRFLREISHGGQGTVYEAIQEQTERKVAVKVIPGGPYVNSASRARFEREAKALAAVEHPNVVGILDRGRTTDGSFFLVMEYVKGPCLDVQIAAWRSVHPFNPQPILVIFSKIARALHAVHQSGIVHRDLKPSNVVIDCWGEPRVVDFGLSKALGVPDGGQAYTLTGQIIGSLSWASPEQAAGRSVNLDERSDVYSLGVMLHQALTGSFPYPVNGTISETLANIQNVVPRSTTRLNRSWAGLDAHGIDAVLQKSLAKAPKDRYATAADLAADLDHLLARQPTIAQPKFGSRSRTGLAYAATAVLALTVSAATVLHTTQKEPPVTVFSLPQYVNSVNLKLVQIPAGTFMMGSGYNEEGRQSDEAPHQIRVESPFWIGTTDITRRQFKAVMGSGQGGDDGTLPIVNVSCSDALEFCRRLSLREHRTYRLPSETEWEHACRAGSSSPISGTRKLESMGWFGGNSGGKIHPVAQLSPNCWGLFDMHGNVNEWCSDSYNRYGAHDDPQEEATPFGLPHVIRGGSFKQSYGACRAGARSHSRPEQREDDLGFRVAMDP
jgi:serine/threonine protein kinase